MIVKIRLLRNVGTFDSVTAGAAIPFSRLTVIYAENGRGKTTLAAVLRSLATGDPLPISERRRLAAQHPPHIIVDLNDTPQAMFQTGVWNRTLPEMVVFDDVFVDENVFSGLAVDSNHRQKLHELVVGAAGVALNRQLQGLVQRIEEHNTALRTLAAAIPQSERGPFSVDAFCDLTPRPDIAGAVLQTERQVAAARQRDAIRTAEGFATLGLPTFDAESIAALMAEDLPTLDGAALDRLRGHLATLGPGGEQWVADGVARLTVEHAPQDCPFCGQDLAGSALLDAYRGYFSAEYADLVRRIESHLQAIRRNHGGPILAAFERAVRTTIQRQQFWSTVTEVPDVDLNTAEISRDWQAAIREVETILNAKKASPLTRVPMPDSVTRALHAFNQHSESVAALSQRLLRVNESIPAIRERAEAGNAQALEADLAKLRAEQVRFTDAVAKRCDEYIAERAAKAATELQRDTTRTQLNRHRATIFPAYETSINQYLQRFNAGFRLAGVVHTDTRGGATCNYDVVVNGTRIPIAGATSPGEPAFRSALSAGDRNTLALAFFFASLDNDAGRAHKVVVIDDPISSLDEHRSLTTVQEVRRLSQRSKQVILLSHNKPFLARTWEGTDPTLRAALEVDRDATGSTLRPWDVSQDAVNEHDRRHRTLREYLAGGVGDDRDVARSIRPVLEAFFRVARPEHFPPGTLLGPFRGLCEQRVGTPGQILCQHQIDELRDLVEYANRFHHDTNEAWETEQVNTQELAGFVRRTLDFAR